MRLLLCAEQSMGSTIKHKECISIVIGKMKNNGFEKLCRMMKARSLIFFLLFSVSVSAQNSDSVGINFHTSSSVLYDRYSTNSKELAALNQIVSNYEDVILTGNGHIRLIANIPAAQKENLVSVNMGALRAAVISNYLRAKFRFLTSWNFSYLVNITDDAPNTISVSYTPSTLALDAPRGVYYTEDRQNLSAIRFAMAKYGGIPYLNSAKIVVDRPILGTATNEKATEAIAAAPVKGEPNPQDVLIAIYYRWDKSNLDSLYLSNPQNLHLLDSILMSKNARYIDTLTIVAYASPEGHPKHNQDLSEWRAATIKEYILSKYPTLSTSRIVTEARGENWQGVFKFAEADNDLPSRDRVLAILKGTMSDLARQKALVALDGGATYYRYILPNYYRYLRNGASIFITYTPDITKEPDPVVVIEPEPEQEFIVIVEPEPITRYPIALRTNLLYDAVGAVNLGVEVPIKSHFSVIGDFAYSYWRSSKNLYALQTLEYGVEGRYWFGVSERRKDKKPSWAKPLKGWNLGVYGRYWHRYDGQYIDGVQGDGTWSAGVTGGYAFPIAKQLSLEAGMGAGWVSTSQYRHYHRPEYDKDGKYYLMWQETGRWSGLSITKVRLSLVWLIESKKRGEQK